MDNKEQNLRAELAELESKLQDPSIFSDPSYPKLAKRKAQVDDLVALFDERAKLAKDKADAEELRESPDAELQQMALIELEELGPKIELNEQKLIEALTPQDPNNDRDVIIEIRAAAGGDESALFAGELYRMYARWCETHGFKTELMSESPSEAGGFKEIIFAVLGVNIFQNRPMAVRLGLVPPRSLVTEGWEPDILAGWERAQFIDSNIGSHQQEVVALSGLLSVVQMTRDQLLAA